MVSPTNTTAAESDAPPPISAAVPVWRPRDAAAPDLVPLRPVLPTMTPGHWSLVIGSIAILTLLSSLPYSDTLRLMSGQRPTTVQLLIVTLANSARWALMTYPVFWVSDHTMQSWRGLSPLIARTIALAITFWPIGVTSFVMTVLPLPEELQRAGTGGIAWMTMGSLSWFGDTFLLFVVTLAIYVFIQRLQRSQDAVVRASELQIAVAEARFASLSSELQPHFLLNTLNGIAELVLQKPERAERMVLDLSVLLRLTLRDLGQRTISMETELERVDRYLALQQARFGDRLSVRRRIDPAVLRAAVPPMLLQPIVENAIKHGIEQQSEPGTISIAAERSGDTLSIVVTDTGPGPSASRSRGNGLGLSHTRARLAAVFGDTASLTLAPGVTGGTVVTATAPFVRYVSSGVAIA